MSAYELVYHAGCRSVLFALGMVYRLARRLVQCNRTSSSEDAELSAFLGQLDDRIEEEIKRADRLLEKLKTPRLPRPDGGPAVNDVPSYSQKNDP